MENTRYVIYC